MKSISVFVSSLVTAALAFSAAANACDLEDEDGFDVALVLSGGGALAMTHVGALAVIEELDIPIHCVTGTSMGAVIGGLYAAGYDAADLKEFFENSDWAEAFRGDIARRDKPYLEKENEDQYFSDYVAGVSDDGIKLPGGLRSMNGLKRHFRQWLSHVAIDTDFDTLRVPYRAAVTDLSTGDAAALASGDLVEAMLASMAVPGAFGAREINGRTYVDGGLAAQLPVEIAHGLGADIIIAIDTTIEPPEVDAALSITDMTQQLVRVAVYKNWKEQVALLKEKDALLRPDISQLTAASFEKTAFAFQSGREEANKFRAQLLAIKALAAPRKENPIDPETPPDLSGDLIIANNTALDDDVIRRRLDYDPKQPPDPATLDRRLRSLAAFGGFGEVDLGYQDGSPVLSVNERPLGKNLLQAGARVSNTFNGDSTHALLARYSRRPISRRGGEFSASIEAGTNIGVTAQLYQPFGDKGQYFVIPAIAYRGQEVLFDIQDIRIGEFWQQTGGAHLRLGRELGNWGVIGVEGAAILGRLRAQVAIAPEILEPIDYAIGGGGVFFSVDTLDRTDWPTKGWQFRAAGQRLFDFDDGVRTDTYDLFAMKAAQVKDFGLLLRGQAQSVQNKNNDPIEFLNLGGFRRLSAFSENSLPNTQYVLGSIEVYRRLTAADTVLSFPIYAGLNVEYANIEFDFIEEGATGNFASGGFYLGAETVLGPAFLGAGFSEEGQHSVFFHFGRSF